MNPTRRLHERSPKDDTGQPLPLWGIAMDVKDRREVWLENLRDERDRAALYEGLAQLEKDPARAAELARLAEAERRHAEIWARKLEQSGTVVGLEGPSARIRAVLWMARHLGVPRVLPLVVQAELADAAKYARQGGEAAQLVREEEKHKDTLAELGGADTASAANLIVSRERWHKGGRSGSVRAAVFGMNDGIVSNLSLVLGVAGAGVEPRTILITGVAGLLAGAFSMAAGEYISVASQRDLLARQIELERRELAEAPQEEAAELALIYQRKGLSPEQAVATAKELLKNPEAALDTLVREELGLDPSDLGSPISAALSSFITFAFGAVMPILPFIFLRGVSAVGAASGLALAVLLSVGGLLGYLSGSGALRSALRMAGLASIAAGVTYAIGLLFGATVS